MARALTRVWTAPVHPEPVNRTASCSPAPEQLICFGAKYETRSCLCSCAQCLELRAYKVLSAGRWLRSWCGCSHKPATPGFYNLFQGVLNNLQAGPLLWWNPLWTQDFGQRQCSRSIKQFSFQMGCGRRKFGWVKIIKLSRKGTSEKWHPCQSPKSWCTQSKCPSQLLPLPHSTATHSLLLQVATRRIYGGASERSALPWLENNPKQKVSEGGVTLSFHIEGFFKSQLDRYWSCPDIGCQHNYL